MRKLLRTFHLWFVTKTHLDNTYVSVLLPGRIELSGKGLISDVRCGARVNVPADLSTRQKHVWPYQEQTFVCLQEILRDGLDGRKQQESWNVVFGRRQSLSSSVSLPASRVKTIRHSSVSLPSTVSAESNQNGLCRSDRKAHPGSISQHTLACQVVLVGVSECLTNDAHWIDASLVTQT